MSKKAMIYIGFFVVLVFTFFFWIRPYLVPEKYISSVQPFEFTNQDGKSFSNKDVEGKVYVAEFFFTTCQAICPQMHGNMRKVYDELKNEKDFLIVSHTCQPENDSVPRLRVYADSMNVDTQKWVFLTGRKDSLYSMARFSYTIDNPQYYVTKLTDDFIHTQFWALVNKKGKVIAVYDGIKPSEAEEMITRVRKLLKE
jgi:protein SCO1/2